MAESKFIAEIFNRTEYPPEGAIAADDIDRVYNVYKLGIETPTVSTNKITPTAEYHFDNTLADEQGGSPITVPAGTPVFESGVVDQAAGNARYEATGITPGTEGAISFWAKFTNASDAAALFHFVDAASDNIFIRMRDVTSGVPTDYQFYIRDVTAGQFKVVAGGTILTGIYQHFVASWDNGTVTFYLDSTLIGSVIATTPGWYPIDQLFRLGQNYTSTGQVNDDFRIFNTAITADEVKALYNEPQVPVTVGGVTYSYWEDAFGGNYDDIPDTENVQILMGQFLQRVESKADMETTLNSFWINAGEAYMNLPKKPWQYRQTETELLTARGFSSGPKDSSNPSDLHYGGIYYPSRLELPSVETSLSDPVSGLTLFPEWPLTFSNVDGEFDDFDENNVVNTPVRLLKSTVDVPTLADFKIIRYGLINDQTSDETTFTISASDVWTSVEEEVCDTFQSTDFSSAPTKTLGKNIPRVAGGVDGVPLFEVGTRQYYASSDTTAVSAVYDKDGNTLNFTFNSNTKIITQQVGTGFLSNIGAPPLAVGSTSIPVDTGTGTIFTGDRFKFAGDSTFYEHTGADVTTAGTLTISAPGLQVALADGVALTVFAEEAKTADITGSSTQRIGQMVVDILEERSNINYNDSQWNTTEADTYRTTSPQVDFYFDGGTVRDYITKLLANDNAFLIQQNNGLLTLRKWGVTYDTHTIPSYQITQKPSKDIFDARNNYVTSVQINYAENINSGVFAKSYQDTSQELTIAENFRKKRQGVFNLQLSNDADVTTLATSILDRFGDYKQTINVGVSYDTSEINLLDSVTLDPTINGREFSTVTSWIVKGVDPAQDTVTLEET